MWSLIQKPLNIELKKHSEYGNLVSYLPTKETTVWTKENMSHEQIDYIEPCIAKTLYDLLYPSIFLIIQKRDILNGYLIFLWMMIRLNLPGNGENKLKKYKIWNILLKQVQKLLLIK